MIDLLVEKIQRNKRKLDSFLLYCDPLAYCSLSNVTSTEFEFSYKSQWRLPLHGNAFLHQWSSSLSYYYCHCVSILQEIAGTCMFYVDLFLLKLIIIHQVMKICLAGILVHWKLIPLLLEFYKGMKSLI